MKLKFFITLGVFGILFFSCKATKKHDSLFKGKEIVKYSNYFFESTCLEKAIIEINIPGDTFRPLSVVNNVSHTEGSRQLKLVIDNPEKQEDFMYMVALHNGENLDTLFYFVHSCLKKVELADYNTSNIDTIPLNCTKSRSVIVDYNGTVGFLSLSRNGSYLFENKAYSTIDDVMGFYSIDLAQYDKGYFELETKSRHGVYLYQFFLQ